MLVLSAYISAIGWVPCLHRVDPWTGAGCLLLVLFNQAYATVGAAFFTARIDQVAPVNRI